mmetsp:Transcript_67739/g.144964  ORF Transcript_67739/g.144964 Transcript_67739/m.144964 type:complete len:244 (-) Transcript_67739:613-1344(-)
MGAAALAEDDAPRMERHPWLPVEHELELRARLRHKRVRGAKRCEKATEQRPSHGRARRFVDLTRQRALSIDRGAGQPAPPVGGVPLREEVGGNQPFNIAACRSLIPTQRLFDSTLFVPLGINAKHIRLSRTYPLLFPPSIDEKLGVRDQLGNHNSVSNCAPSAIRQLGIMAGLQISKGSGHNFDEILRRLLSRATRLVGSKQGASQKPNTSLEGKGRLGLGFGGGLEGTLVERLRNGMAGTLP